MRGRLFLVFLRANLLLFARKEKEGLQIFSWSSVDGRKGDTDLGGEKKGEVCATTLPKGELEFVKANTSAPG